MYFPGGLYLVHGVEVNARRAAFQQGLAQLGDHLDTKLANTLLVLAVALDALADPARDFRTAIGREAGGRLMERTVSPVKH